MTFNARAAWIAAHSVSATTPTKFSCCTSLTTPEMCRMELSSMLAGLELTTGGRTTRP